MHLLSGRRRLRDVQEGLHVEASKGGVQAVVLSADTAISPEYANLQQHTESWLGGHLRPHTFKTWKLGGWGRGHGDTWGQGTREKVTSHHTFRLWKLGDWGRGHGLFDPLLQLYIKLGKWHRGFVFSEWLVRQPALQQEPHELIFGSQWPGARARRVIKLLPKTVRTAYQPL